MNHRTNKRGKTTGQYHGQEVQQRSTGFSKDLLGVLLFSLLFQTASAQFLHIGLGGSGKSMNFLEKEELKSYTLYFANGENETIQFQKFEDPDNLFFSPSLYVQYQTKNNFFGEVDFSVNRPVSVATYENTVPIGTFFADLNTEYDILNNSSLLPEDELISHHQLTLKWTFVESAFNVGYYFRQTKVIQPSLFVGYTNLYRMAMNLHDHPETNDKHNARTKVMFDYLNTLKTWTHFVTVGGGLKYHQFSLIGFYKHNIGQSDRELKAKEIDPNAPDSDANTVIRNYEDIFLFGFTLRVDLFNVNMEDKSAKQKIGRIGQ